MSRASAGGFSLIEMLTAATVIAIIAAIAIPGLMRARMASNEVSAIASMRSINSAEAAFAVTCGKDGYATSLADLAKAAPGQEQAFIGADLGWDGIVKSGYVNALTRGAAADVVDVGTAAGTCNASSSTPATSYFASSVPTSFGVSGRRYFATDKRGAVFEDVSAAIANPIPASATPAQ